MPIIEIQWIEANKLMDQLYRISNQYFKDFYSYKAVLLPLALNILLAAIAFMFFVWSALSYVGIPYVWQGYYTFGERYALLLFKEFIAIISLLRLQKLKDDETIKLMSNKLALKGTYKSDAIKRKWLRQTFDVNELYFFELAEKFDCLVTSKKKYKSRVKVTWGDLPSLIFDQDAKARTLALFLALCSILVALSVKGSLGIESVYAEYSALSFKDLTYNIFIYSTAALIVLVGVNFLFNFLIMILSLTSAAIDGKHGQNDNIAKYLIRDLYKYSRVRVGKLKEGNRVFTKANEKLS